MTLVVDASVAAKWILQENDSARAASIRTTGEDFIAPSLVFAEIANAIWKAVLRGDIPARNAGEGLHLALGHFQQVVPLEDLNAEAIKLATDLRHPVYDCYYLALAQRENVAIVTADEDMIAVARKAKVKAKRL